MREISDSVRQKYFTLGVAISLSAATFASPVSEEMEKPWRVDGKKMSASLALGVDPGLAQKKFFLGSKVSRQPWSGPWWATSAGSVAARWKKTVVVRNGKVDWLSNREADIQNFHEFSSDELWNMSEAEIRDKTSPIEKLDIVSGHTRKDKDGYYQNLRKVRADIASVEKNYPDELSFHGICHGFAHAAIWLPEPGETRVPAKLVRADGSAKVIDVVFPSADMKAIASYFYGEESGAYSANQLLTGNKLFEKGYTENDPWAPITAGVFHLLLTNLVGDADQSFVVDIARGNEVWNFPVAGFRTRVFPATYDVFRGADPRVVREVLVQTDVDYVPETNPYDIALGPFPRKGGFDLKTVSYAYYLQIGAADEVIDGYWTGYSERPDFAWSLRKGKIPFTGDFAIFEDYWPTTPATPGT